MAADPLTTVEAMLAMIEPGPRLIDASLLKQLYLSSGHPGLAASLDPGYRMVDVSRLHDLAVEVGAQVAEPIFGDPFQGSGYRLIEGFAWRSLAMQAQVPPGPGQWGGTDVWGGGQNWL